MPTNNVTVAIRIRMDIVFHRNRCEHPRRSEGEAGPGSSSALYLKSDDLRRSERRDGMRGKIFGRYTMIVYDDKRVDVSV